MNQAILDDAILFKALGLDIILVDGKTKNPGIVADWPVHKWPEAELKSWLTRRDDLSLAIRLGDVIDVEIDCEDTAEQTALELEFAPLAGTTVSWRSRRGRHWLFKLTEQQRAELIERDTPNVVKINKYEFRLGFKPAQSLIPTPGDDYRQWVEKPINCEIVNLPTVLYQQLFTATTKKIEPKPTANVSHNQRPGDIFNERVSWDDILTPRGWRMYEDRGGVQHWTRPGKTHGLSATTGHCSSDTRGDLFFCFSSAPEIEPIEPNQSYSKFELWTLLEHGGDYSAAAVAALKEGYTPQSECDEFDDLPEIEQFPVREIAVIQESISQTKADITGTPVPDNIVYDFVLGEYVQKLIPYTEAYPPAILFQLMEVAGILAGRQTYFLHGDYQFRLNGGTIVIGESGVSRKGTGLHYARLPFRDDENENTLNEILSENSQVSGEGFIQAIANKPSHTLLIACEEFASVLKGAKREGSTLSDTIRNAMDTKALGIDARKNPIPTMYDAFASIIGHCTLDEFISNISLQDIHNGFLNRFQFTLSRQNSKIAFPESVPDIIKLPVKEAFSKMMGPKEFSPAVVLSFADDARPVWSDFYYASSEDRSSSRESLAARAPAQVLRNASRIALLEDSTQVDARRLRIALAMLKYSQDCIDYIFGDYLNDDEDELIHFLTSDKNGKSWHDINEWVARWRKSKRQTKRIVTRMLDKGFVTVRAVKTNEGAGRPANRLIYVGGAHK